MNFDAEAEFDLVETLGHGQSGLRRPEIGVEGEDLRGHLMAALGPPLGREESNEALVREGGLSLVEGGTRDAEIGGDFTDGLGVDFVAANHLIANLDEIGGIKKRAVGEQGVADCLGSWVEGAVADDASVLPVEGLGLAIVHLLYVITITPHYI